MSSSCETQCGTTEFFANLKCPNCFGKKVSICKNEAGEPATGECEICDCRFELNPELTNVGMD